MHLAVLNILRVLPFAAWLWAQLAMAAAGPVAAEAGHGREPPALAALLPGETLILCHAGADGSGPHAPDAPDAHGLGCEWCQTFGQAILPYPDATLRPIALITARRGGFAQARPPIGETPRGYLSRAPPV